FLLIYRRSPFSTLFPYTTLFRSFLQFIVDGSQRLSVFFCGARFGKNQFRFPMKHGERSTQFVRSIRDELTQLVNGGIDALQKSIDRKSTRLNSSHVSISYAVFCL